MRPIVLAVHQLGSGGVTNAVLDQASMFSGAGYETRIATFDDHPAAAERVDALRADGRLPASVTVANPHQEARAQAPAVPEAGSAEDTPPFGSGEAPEFVESGTDGHGAYRRLFARDGEYHAFERLDPSGGVRHVNRFENRRLVRRDHLHRGVTHRRTWFDGEGAENREAFFRSDGFCYVQRWIDPATGKGVGVYAADPMTRRVTRYGGMPDWHVAWLQGLVDRHPRAPYVIAQTASVIPKMLRLRRESAVRIAMMHNSQVAAPFAVDSPLRPDYDATFARLAKLDAFAILSDRQRRDMARRLGSREVFTVVPNALHGTPDPQEPRDPHLVSVISRLAPQKALHEAIHAFAVVHRAVPRARLEIYGSGVEQASLQGTIDELGLQGVVRLMGRTSSPQQVMARSVCTLSTSEWEALPLSIAESLAVRTPVVAYDCLYGPSTLIRSGTTGVLVPRHARDELARAVIALLRDPSRVEAVGAAGRADITARLSFGTVLTAWRETFEHAERRARLP